MVKNEVKEYATTPSRDEMVLNIMGTRVMLPSEPDYDINWLPPFVKEAWGSRGVRG